MKAFVGELIGTFVLTLFGCGSVAVAVLFGEYGSIFQIALVWGIGVTLAIYLTRHLSCAHLNPAVTVAMVLSKRMKADAFLPIGPVCGGVSRRSRIVWIISAYNFRL